MSFLEIVLSFLFLVIAVKLIYSVGQFFYTSFFASILGKNLNLRNFGQWAVVTGATDGIGKAYAKELTRLGLNVVLVSRNEKKLGAVATELRSLNSEVEVKTIAVDFTGGPSIYDKLEKELAELEIGMLVNNVGMAVGLGLRLSEIRDTQALHDIINCNVTSMVRMCHLVLPQMKERGKGIIVNVGSVLGNIPSPGAIVYGATKSFVDKFSRDLAAEVRPSGIIVQTLHPGLVATNMSKVTRASIYGPSADTYAAAAVKTIGLEARTAGYWFHKILLYFGEKAALYFRTQLENKIFITEG